MNHVLLPMAYGAGRATIVNFAQPITSRVPLGNYADELVLGVGGYLLAKKSSGTLKEVGKAVLMIESASLGSQLVSNNMGSSNSSFYN
jgi:C4-dicarboxylate transporter